MEYTVYILFSETLNKYYIGYTSGPIDERVRKHLTAHSGFTSHAKDWILKYQEHFIDKLGALKREKVIKSWKKRDRIEALFRSGESQLPDD